jgi:hypothetical protein
MKEEEKVAEIKEQLERGEYGVEPDAVADALLRQLRELAAARRERVTSRDRAWAAELAGHMWCSYPDSAPASANVAFGAPARTRPMKVSSTVVGRLSHSVASTVRALGGTLTHSS